LKYFIGRAKRRLSFGRKKFCIGIRERGILVIVVRAVDYLTHDYKVFNIRFKSHDAGMWAFTTPEEALGKAKRISNG
jgi:hypothetical protein